MILPLAIHTARQGYAWLNASQHDLALLERFRKAIGRMPDLDYGAPLSCGVLNDGNWVVVYRFMVEKKGDFLGRDCIYLAVTCFKRSFAASVHVARLLEAPVFTATMHEPPTCFEYDAGDSCPCPCDPEAMTGVELAGLDFAQAGSAFQYPFAGTLRITQEVGSKIVVTYSEAVQQLTKGTEPGRAEESPLLAIGDVHLEEKPSRKKRVSCIGWAVAAAALLIAAWILDRETAKQSQGKSPLSSCVAVLADSHVAAPSTPTDVPPAKAAKDELGARYLCRVPAEANRQPSEWQDNQTGSIMHLQFLKIKNRE